MHRFAILFGLITVLLVQIGSAQPNHFFDRTPHKIYVQDESSLRELAALRLDVDRASVDGGPSVEAYLNADEVNLLAGLGYRVEPIPDEGYLGYLRELERMASKSPMDTTRDYHTYETLVAELQSIAAAHPSFCNLYNIGPTVQGRALWFMQISDNPDLEEDELEFWYISSMHGNEVVGKEMCMYLINYLVDNYGLDPAITALINETDIWIMPSMNPDGTANGSRYNANGVDLNRNFPDRVVDPINTTQGREIEVADVMNWNFDHGPVMSANFHCGTLAANYPWDGCWDPQANAAYTDNQDWVLGAAQAYAYNNPAMYNNNTPPFVHGVVNGVDWYQITGGLQDWSYNWMGDMDITMEISNVNWPPANTLPGYWEDNRAAMLAYMQYAHRGVRGLVTNASTGAPLPAQIKILGRDDFTVNTDPDVGDYHYPLNPGAYGMDVSSFGFWPAHFTGIQVQQGSPTRVDVQLEPADLMNFVGTIHNYGGGYMSARLILLGTPYDTVLTNIVGGFTFSNVYEGEYILRVESLTSGALADVPVVLDAGMPPFIIWGPAMLTYDSFETGLGSWAAQGSWGLSGNAYAGVQSLADSPSGNYGNNLNISCTYNNALNLTDFDIVTLSYRTRFNCETNFDTLFAEVSPNGTAWNAVNYHNSRQDWWSLETCDLSSYAGTNGLRLRYRLWTDGSVARDGGFFDEIRVCAVSLTPPGQTSSITLTPFGIPIQIPSAGGRFDYNIAVANGGLTPITADIWCDVMLPTGRPYGPTLGPVAITLPAGGSLNRDRTQAIPGAAPEGTYVYHGYIGDYPNTVVDEDSFTFVKLGSDGTAGGEWLNWGEDFPGAASAEVPLPVEFILAQNFPNPFNAVTDIHFALPQAGHVRLEVYNSNGQIVATLADDYYPAGWHRAVWDASERSTGLYIYRLQAGEHMFSQKAILIK